MLVDLHMPSWIHISFTGLIQDKLHNFGESKIQLSIYEAFASLNTLFGSQELSKRIRIKVIYRHFPVHRDRIEPYNDDLPSGEECA